MCAELGSTGSMILTATFGLNPGPHHSGVMLFPLSYCSGLSVLCT